MTAEPNANVLLVRGPRAALPEVMQIIQRLDAGGTRSAVEIRVYVLTNADVTDLAAAVGGMFR